MNHWVVAETDGNKRIINLDNVKHIATSSSRTDAFHCDLYFCDGSTLIVDGTLLNWNAWISEAYDEET